MPFVDRTARATINLYQRCLERKALPHAGGVLDQLESVMEDFDVIDAVIAEHRKKQREEAQLRMMAEGATTKQHGRH